MRLIDADPISNALQKQIIKYMRKSLDEIDENPDNPLAGRNASFTAEVLKCVKDMLIDDSPTIEAEPVRHGKWEIHGIAEVCDQCHTHIVIEQYDHDELNRCPHCGAKMDLKEKDK